MSHCKHANTETRWHLDKVRCGPMSPPVYVELLRCVDCDELVGIGPAKETPEVDLPPDFRRPIDRVVTCNEPSCCFTDRCQAPDDCRGRQ